MKMDKPDRVDRMEGVNEVNEKEDNIINAAIEEVKRLLKIKLERILAGYDLGEFLDESYCVHVDEEGISKIILGIVKEKGTYIVAGIYVDEEGKIVDRKPLEKVKLRYLLAIINDVLPSFTSKIEEIKKVNSQRLLVDLKKAIDTLEKM